MQFRAITATLLALAAFVAAMPANNVFRGENALAARDTAANVARDDLVDEALAIYYSD
ncbi:hypothetical protein EIP86_008180 [Pleurotus ostreatoroseus]|nr:hypothetical protein EIP86_008180 [Pleurotus ostreatoroseus]